MDLLEKPTNSFINELPNPNYYNTQIDTLTQQLPPILDDYQKYYVFTHMTPESNEYQQLFLNIQSNLQNLNAKLFQIKNGIEKNTETINTELLKINTSINNHKLENNRVKNLLGMTDYKYKGSDEMILNYKEMYNLEYLNNFSLIIGIITSGIIIKTFFASKTNNSL